jgi:hypothetical protein
MFILVYMVAGGLAVGILYSAFKLWDDAPAGRRRPRFLGLALLGALVLLSLLLGLGLH